jgi:hypothetical protein
MRSERSIERTRVSNEPRRKQCDACDAVEDLSDTTVSLSLADGWERVLPQKGEDDPELLVMWNASNVRQTVASINAGGGSGLPVWLGAGIPIDENNKPDAVAIELR